jgi:processive 1,2-diacylglycerol beta-glucosyltransferase
MVKRRKSILILSATAGAGHVRAGDALMNATRNYFQDIDIHHEDILNFTSPVFKKLYNDVYVSLVAASPEFWGYLYNRAGHGRSSKKKSFPVKLFDYLNYKKYLRVIDELQPDAVLCTHFLPYLAIADTIQSTGWKIPFFVATTDYDVHPLWIHPAIRRYYTASDETAWTIRSFGIPADMIKTTGIPIMPRFAQHCSRRAIRAALDISEKSFTIMILSGGYGIGVIDKLVPSVAEFLGTFSRKKFQLLVICGKNQKLYNTLSRASYPGNVSVIVYPFIQNIDELMSASDLLITKSGGLTVAEALAKHLPMIIFDPIPGQEARNAYYLIEHGAAMTAFSFPNLHFKLQDLIDHPQSLRSMQSAATQIAHPDAACEILRDLLSQIDSRE